ncbi:MAG: malto-oligosyltrehalose trehalohydrolase [Deltaproteobacteria bacterium]|nr:malto-oligosyltrehalose trehalohydrolase [Deltaproteobacteria bacterium]
MFGAEVLPGGGVRFSAWAPRPRSVALRIVGYGGDLPMQQHEGGTCSVVVPGASAGARYFFVLDGDRARPDPCSRFQPDGVHGPSQVVCPSTFSFRHPSPTLDLTKAVLYELHVGTFTREGTFAAAARELPVLKELGVDAVELMPVSAFPGERNWGYDGVHPFAPCAAYGSPDDLRAFTDTAHSLELAVIMDVVYNHLGPEGNYLTEFAPYFSPQRRTLWGDAPDFSRREVRDWLLDNALAWLREYRVDGLRVDAVHAMFDDSPKHVLAELCEKARPGLLIAETDMNDVKVFDDWGFDACWSDDFHHALHACLTGERTGYYRSFGDLTTLATTIESGWIRGPHPCRSRAIPGPRFIVASQTHDQVGNRAMGERLSHLVGLRAARLAAVATLAAVPCVPILFMGEEFASSSPFQYFTSHGDPALARAVSLGRRRDLEAQGFSHAEQAPDPQEEGTFLRSRIDLGDRLVEPHAATWRLYRDLLTLRRRLSSLGAQGKQRCRAWVDRGAAWVDRGDGVQVVLNVGDQEVRTSGTVILHSEDARYGGSLGRPTPVLPPRSACILKV